MYHVCKDQQQEKENHRFLCPKTSIFSVRASFLGRGPAKTKDFTHMFAVCDGQLLASPWCRYPAILGLLGPCRPFWDPFVAGASSTCHSSSQRAPKRLPRDNSKVQLPRPDSWFWGPEFAHGISSNSHIPLLHDFEPGQVELGLLRLPSSILHQFCFKH